MWPARSRTHPDVAPDLVLGSLPDGRLGPGLSVLHFPHMRRLPSYAKAWLALLHKLRRVAVNANRDLLAGTVEIDATRTCGNQLGLQRGRQLVNRKA